MGVGVCVLGVGVCGRVVCVCVACVRVCGVWCVGIISIIKNIIIIIFIYTL